MLIRFTKLLVEFVIVWFRVAYRRRANYDPTRWSKQPLTTQLLSYATDILRAAIGLRVLRSVAQRF